MWKFAAISLLTIFLVWLWEVFKWIWLEPKRLERLLRQQGFGGNSYKLLLGDTKEIADMYEETHSRPLGLHDDIVPHIMPFVVKTINTYGSIFIFLFLFALHTIDIYILFLLLAYFNLLTHLLINTMKMHLGSKSSK